MPVLRATSSLGTMTALAVLAVLAPAAGAVDWSAAEQRARQALRNSAGLSFDAAIEFRATATPVPRLPTDSQALPDQCAYYDRSQRVVLIDINACRHRLFALMQDTAECDDAAFVLLLHELIHAYQDEQISLHHRPLPSSRWLRFLCEGHAVEFSRRIGAENSVSLNTLAKLYQVPIAAPQPDLAKRRAGLLFEFNYVLSARYIARQCRKLDGFAELLDQDLNYPAVLALAQDPDVLPLGTALPAPRRIPAAATQPGVHDHQSLTAGRMGDWVLADPLPLDYLDALVYVAPADFADPDVAASYVSATLINASRSNSPVLEACVLHLRDDESAHALWLHACTQHHSWAGDILSASHGDARSASQDESDFCRNWPTQGRTLSLIRHGSYLVVANGIDPEMTSRFVEQLLQKAFSVEPLP